MAADPDVESRRTRRRGMALVSAIHQAALAELEEVGLEALTMEGIARRAGTAKTSLYRRWSEPGEIVIDAIGAGFPREEVSPTADDLRGDLIRALQLMISWVNDPTGRAVQAIVAARDRRPDLYEALYPKVFDPFGGRFTATVLQHYAAAGTIDRARLTPVVIDIGEALTFKYSLDHWQHPDAEALGAIVDQAILPAVGLAPGGGTTNSP